LGLGQFGRADGFDHLPASGAIVWPSAWRLAGTLQNSRRLMLLALRPFRIGEYVEVGSI